MSNNETLIALADKFRAALLLTKPAEYTGTSLSASEFPLGCCDDASRMLAAYLVDNGFKNVNLIFGENVCKSIEISAHVWLQIGKVNVDITADQFNFLGYKNSGILCGEKIEFLDTFSLRNDGDADFRVCIPPDDYQDLLLAFVSGFKTIKSKFEA